MNLLTVNGERLQESILTLGKIGFQEGDGTTRLSYSPAFEEGRNYVELLMKEAGLVTKIDRVGNLTGLLAGKKDAFAGNSNSGEKKGIIAVGSHIDSVPGGGMYDGTYGVLAAIECIKTLREAGYENRHPIEVIAFIEEEGNVIGGTFGSECFVGNPAAAAAEKIEREFGITRNELKSCRRNPGDYKCYLELHIEQGGILESLQKDIGIAEGIVGILRFRTVVSGEANHAGSTPMNLRRDALEKSCILIAELIREVRENHPGMVCTVGKLDLMPGAVNVIPGKVEFIIELRDRQMETMYAVIEDLKRKYGDQDVSIDQCFCQTNTDCHKELTALTESCAKRIGLETMRMFSGAGHDLINMAGFTPSALLFIPSVGGVSHSIREYSSPEQMLAGANVLLQTIVEADRTDADIKQL